MEIKAFTLTKNEREIMELLWTRQVPLSRSEIIDFSENRSWKASSIHILLNQLLDKGAIRVDGFMKTGKNYGRTYTAAVSEEEYHTMQFRSGVAYRHSKSSALVDLVSTLIQDEGAVNANTISQLESLLATKRSELK